MMTLSKTAALKAASKTVTIRGCGTSWTVTGPFSRYDLGGPSTERNVDSYAKARRVATEWLASIALAQMGLSCLDVDAAVYYASLEEGSCTVKTLVEVGVQAHARLGAAA